MVASTHWLASAVGMRCLELRGNAFDAGVAAGFTLQVVEPHLNGPGGDLPAILWSARRGRADVLCAQGVAPAAATPAAFAELGLAMVPGTGLLAACVPGAFDGWMLLLRDLGTLRLRDVLEPAIGYAERGFPVLAGIASALANVETLFREEWTTSAELYLHRGLPAPGTTMTNPVLAATYVALLADAERTTSDREGQIERAREIFYRGWIAEAISDFTSTTSAMDTSGRRHAGLLTEEDLAAWSATLEAPLVHRWRGLEVCKTGPWGQGPVFLQQLALLEHLPVADLEPGSAEYVHALVECAKLAFADREAWYGDPRYVDVPLAELLSERYSADRARLVGEEASFELRPGSPLGRRPRLDTAVSDDVAPGVGEPTASTGDTCHVDVVDRWGNMLSATPSGGWLQSSPAIPRLGFCLGTRAQMFSLVEGLPNVLAPGKRPRTTLSPSLALRDGEPYLAFGTPGGDQQDQWSLHAFLGHALYGLDLQAAVDAPAFHTEHFPSSFFPRRSAPGRVRLERRLGAETIAGLRERGHDVRTDGDWSLGRVSAVGREADGVLKAAANARGMQGYAAGR